jgi:hypothetical protein
MDQHTPTNEKAQAAEQGYDAENSVEAGSERSVVTSGFSLR